MGTPKAVRGRVVITGASRGIGLELARQHAQSGDLVLATCRRPAEARALGELAAAHSGQVSVARLDVADEKSIVSAAAEAAKVLGAVDLVWSSAGIFPGSPGTEVPEVGLGSLSASDGAEVFLVNSIGPLLVAQAFLPLLHVGRRPKLVALSSGYGSVSRNRGTPYWYGASKAALNMLHRSLAYDAEARGVVVLLVSPGWAQTDMGGPHATTPVAEVVAGMRRVVEEADASLTGCFIDWRGAPVPW